jgi:phosphoadenosine phosphosulfate reductase
MHADKKHLTRRMPPAKQNVLRIDNALARTNIPRMIVRTEETLEDDRLAASQEVLAVRAARFNLDLRYLSVVDRLHYLRREASGKIVLTTAFGAESQILMHLLAEHNIAVDVVTLDTGRLFPETYALWAETERRYGRRIRAFYPRNDVIESLVAAHGINGFYNSKQARLSCCNVRKVEPLERALAGADVWVTGLRATQSKYRAAVGLARADEAHGVVKVNPLFDWTLDDVIAFARENAVPLNPLHEQGFVSIGCSPCTRATRPGDVERSGRWWWEASDHKECGLHHRGKTADLSA